jgi:hypothetical protein
MLDKEDSERDQRSVFVLAPCCRLAAVPRNAPCCVSAQSCPSVPAAAASLACLKVGWLGPVNDASVYPEQSDAE